MQRLTCFQSAVVQSLKRKKAFSPSKKTPGGSSNQQFGQLMAAHIEEAAKGVVAATLAGDNLVQRVQALEKKIKLMQDSLFSASGRK